MGYPGLTTILLQQSGDAVFEIPTAAPQRLGHCVLYGGRAAPFTLPIQQGLQTNESFYRFLQHQHRATR
jgi:hypothetical protein